MQFNRKRLGLLLVAILPIATSWMGIATARSGLEVLLFPKQAIPLLYLAPQRASAVPGVWKVGFASWAVVSQATEVQEFPILRR